MNVNLLQVFGLLLTSMGDAQAQNQQLAARVAQLEKEMAELKAAASGAGQSTPPPQPQTA